MKKSLICAALAALITPVVQRLIPESQFHFMLTTPDFGVRSVFMLLIGLDTVLAIWSTLGLWEPKRHLEDAAKRIVTAIFAGLLFELQVYLIFRASPYRLDMTYAVVATDVMTVALGVLAALIIHRYLIDDTPLLK